MARVSMQQDMPDCRTTHCVRTLGAVVGGGALVAAAAVGMRLRFTRQIHTEITELLAARTPAAPRVLTEADIAGLPEPVQRWLRWSGAVGQARPGTVRLRYGGAF